MGDLPVYIIAFFFDGGFIGSYTLVVDLESLKRGIGSVIVRRWVDKALKNGINRFFLWKKRATIKIL